jgi:undecaprenyl-diphosphatase
MGIFNSSFLIFNSLQGFDRDVVLAVNRSHTPMLDAVMVFASDRAVWFPAYALLIVALIYLYRRRAWLLLPLLIVAVALADSITSRLFKPYFERLRPCHEPALAPLLHLPDGCGGQFGFLSSHAANSFALAFFMLLTLPKGRFGLGKAAVFAWALLLSYSRIYLGAHYLTDVLGGALVGSALAVGAAWAYQRFNGRWHPKTT